MSNDYADRWAARERYLNRMSEDDRDFYVAGLAHAYADMFAVFNEAFQGATPRDLHAVFERISAQWDAVKATQVVKGAL